MNSAGTPSAAAANAPRSALAAVLTSAGELAGAIASEPALVLLDVRWKLGQPDGRERYEQGHIPGAVFVEMESELAAPPSPVAGRHPLPPLGALQAAARRWGIRQDSTVVVYDDNGNQAAARAWWLLRWGGLTRVTMLDGALAAWREAGGPLQVGFVAALPGDVVLSGGALAVIDADEAAELPARGVLLDARAAERYRGETEPIDPRAGHIPGATSAPTTENLSAEGTFRGRDELRERFRALGVDGAAPVAVYCGSGVTAAHEIAALAIAGFDAALYPGSWSQWASDPARPVAVGEREGTAAAGSAS